MPKVVSNKRPQISLGLSGLAGAFEGKVAGKEKNIERQLMERDQSRQEASLNETVRNNAVMQEMAARQLEVMQEQNRLTREQEDKLTRYRQEQAGNRQTQDIAARMSMQDRGIAADQAAQSSQQEFESGQQARRLDQADAASMRSAAAANYATQVRASTSQARLDQEREQFQTGFTQLSMSGDVLEQYGGDWAAMNEEQRRSAAEQLAINTVGSARWHGDSLVPMASDEVKQKALQESALQLATHNQRMARYTDEVTQAAIMENDAAWRLENGEDTYMGGVDGDPDLGEDRVSAIFDIGGPADPATGLPQIDSEYLLSNYGSVGVQKVEDLAAISAQTIDSAKKMKTSGYVDESAYDLIMSSYDAQASQAMQSWITVNEADKTLIAEVARQGVLNQLRWVNQYPAGELSEVEGVAVDPEPVVEGE